MKAKLGFYGAARNVTGSCYLLNTGSMRILVDCGYYQERDFQNRNWEPFAFDAKSIDVVLLTHAHLDHCGLLPKLFKAGFNGKVYGTPATADIAKIVMLDSARIQEEDVLHKKKRHASENRKGPHPLVPLYTTEDAEACLHLLEGLEYEKKHDLSDEVSVSFHDAGHILGSAMIRIRFKQNAEERIIIFSGDVGRCNTPILKDPTVFEEADYVLVESTYGDRMHKPNKDIPEALANIINETKKAGGNVVIPSFAIERTQELLYHLNNLLAEDRIPHLPVFLDSPMAIRVTEVFRRHPELFDADTKKLLDKGDHPCDFPGLQLTRTADESKAINNLKESAVIIAGSGMCTGGRIKHHLANNIGRPESTILFVGYQASGTLGRTILEGVDRVRIKGKHHNVDAQTQKINGFSAHADKNELFRWLSGLKTAPRHVFITHGESKAADHFSSWISGKTGWNVSVPEYKQVVELD